VTDIGSQMPTGAGNTSSVDATLDEAVRRHGCPARRPLLGGQPDEASCRDYLGPTGCTGRAKTPRSKGSPTRACGQILASAPGTATSAQRRMSAGS